jgi:5-methylcytosine-specific restriction endonuclease McrA
LKITKRLSELRKAEHENTVQIIEALVICDRERAYLPLGYSTLWAYLTEGLHYSNAAASRRFKAMKCAAKFPQVIDMLRDHRVSLSSLAKAESLLAESGSAAELLQRICGSSAAEVEKIVAAERPRPQKPREKVARVAVQHEDPLFASNPEPMEQRVSLRTTLTEERFEAFEKARAIISRKCPNASVEDVVNELVDQFLASRAPKNKKKPAANKNPTSTTPKARSRHIPKATRDEVMLRDDEQCNFVGEDGHRCTARHNLHIDHIIPFARGGTHDASNLRVLCANHNQHEASKTFGPLPRREPKPLTADHGSGDPLRPAQSSNRERPCPTSPS